MMKRYLSATAVSVAAVVGMAGFGVAQAATTLKIGWTTSDGERDPYAVGARAFKEAAERLSNGELSVQLFPNRQLGDERQMLEGMRFGTVDGGIITNAVIAQLEPAFQLNDMPFLFGNEAQAHRVLDGEYGAELAKRLQAKGIVTLGYMEGGFRSMVNNKRPIVEPNDVNGIKFRVMQNPIYINMFNALGGSAVPMAWGETFTAVQQGTIDGLEIPLAVTQANKYDEVTKYLSLTNHTYSVLGFVISKRSLDKLKPEQREAVLGAAKEAVAAQRKQTAADSQEILEDLEAQRHAGQRNFRRGQIPRIRQAGV
ncbi:TRAP transporter substrate-binding protein [Thauera sp. SDU_THAU2]|uniref:TRAP transporter substrate-binding protein n=1 Tax=Thauera sp. SDU_THAU2 TaxID=3136633 RepID=UPI00311DDFEC